MGYLSQKKHKTREFIFLTVISAVLGLWTLVMLIYPEFKIGFFNLFHVYCLTGLLLVYSLYARRIYLTLVFGILLLLNFTLLEMSGNIFWSDKFNGDNNLELFFDTHRSDISSFYNKNELLSGGELTVSNQTLADFAVVRRDVPITLLRVDFRKINKKSYPNVFKYLQEFITEQDNPIVVFGEFAVPSWHPIFKDFLVATGLKVKNKLLFTSGYKFNIFSTPSFYILGFSQMGVDKIQISKDKPAKIRAKISFSAM